MNRGDPGPRWSIAETQWEPDRNQIWESLFTVANGYLGVRGFPEEGFDAGPSLVGTYVAGVYAPDADGIPELVNVANVLAVRLVLGGRPVRFAPGAVSEYSRTLDMKRGTLCRSFVYRDGGRATRLVFERFASLTQPHLLGQRVVMTPLDWIGRVRISLRMTADVRNQSCRHLRVVGTRTLGPNAVLLRTALKDGRIRLAHACRARGRVHRQGDLGCDVESSRHAVGVQYALELRPGQTAVFERLIATYTSRDQGVTSPTAQAAAAIGHPPADGYAQARRAHVRAWQRVWAGRDVQIDGPAEDQRGVRFAIYHLTQACSHDDPTVSIGAKALSGEAYRGHVFWDTEIFMLPLFTLTDPGAARRLLSYRHHTLPGARKKARENGYDGAMFAWESADTGEETCPRYVPDPKTGEPVRVWCGEIEQHITADVMYGGYQYWQATGDEAFRRTALTEIAVETARFWASRVVWDFSSQRYEIKDVIGPDEYHEHVDNNAFTNFMAAWNLRLAAEWLGRLRKESPRRWRSVVTRLGLRGDEPAHWRDAASKLYVPFDSRRSLHPQDDRFLTLDTADPHALSSRVSTQPERVRMATIWRSQVLKQADVVMLMALWPKQFPLNVQQTNFNYYEPKTTHDSSLSASMHSLVSSRLGCRDKAYEYFRLSALLDLKDRMGNTSAGLHAAAMGGTYQAVVCGFAGLEVARRRPRGQPRLPEAWRSMSFSIRHRGQLYDVRVTPQSCRMRPRVTR